MLAYFVLPVMLLCTAPTENQAIIDKQPLMITLSTEVWQGFTTEDQSGAYFELIRLIFQPYQYKLKVTFTNYNRAVNLVQQRKADMTLAVSAHDNHSVLLSAQPMDEDQIYAIYHSKYQQLNGIADLHSLRLAWNLAYDVGKILALPAPGYEVASVAQGIELVLNQRIDVYLAEHSQIEHYLATKPLLHAPLKMLQVASDPIYAAFADTDAGRQLKCIWDQRFNELRASGELQALYQRHTDFYLLGN